MCSEGVQWHESMHVCDFSQAPHAQWNVSRAEGKLHFDTREEARYLEAFLPGVGAGGRPCSRGRANEEARVRPRLFRVLLRTARAALQAGRSDSCFGTSRQKAPRKGEPPAQKAGFTEMEAKVVENDLCVGGLRAPWRSVQRPPQLRRVGGILRVVFKTFVDEHPEFLALARGGRGVVGSPRHRRASAECGRRLWRRRKHRAGHALEAGRCCRTHSRSRTAVGCLAPSGCSHWRVQGDPGHACLSGERRPGARGPTRGALGPRHKRQLPVLPGRERASPSGAREDRAGRVRGPGRHLEAGAGSVRQRRGLEARLHPQAEERQRHKTASGGGPQEVGRQRMRRGARQGGSAQDQGRARGRDVPHAPRLARRPGGSSCRRCPGRVPNPLWRGAHDRRRLCGLQSPFVWGRAAAYLL